MLDGQESLFSYALKFDEVTQARHYHSFNNFQSTRKRWFIILLILTRRVIPDLTVGTLTIPTEVSIGNRMQ